jgi:hypothetical protein
VFNGRLSFKRRGQNNSQNPHQLQNLQTSRRKKKSKKRQLKRMMISLMIMISKLKILMTFKVIQQDL